MAVLNYRTIEQTRNLSGEIALTDLPPAKTIVKYVVLSILGVIFVMAAITMLFFGLLYEVISFPIFALLTTILILLIGWLLARLDIYSYK